MDQRYKITGTNIALLEMVESRSFYSALLHSYLQMSLASVFADFED